MRRVMYKHASFPKRQSYQIGRFILTGCCGEQHMIIHFPSDTKVVCGLSFEHAARVADSLSLYSKEDPSSKDWETAEKQMGPVVEWAHDAVFDEITTFPEWKKKPKRSLLPVIQPGRMNRMLIKSGVRPN